MTGEFIPLFNKRMGSKFGFTNEAQKSFNNAKGKSVLRNFKIF